MEVKQFEEYQMFRLGRRLEEHVVTSVARTGAVGNPAKTGNHTLKFGTSPPRCVENVLCKQTTVGKQECCNARPVQVFVTRDGHSCCVFFCAAHRIVYKQKLCKMDIVFRRLLRSIVGQHDDVDWNLP